ncbi:uncharacterized protein LOC117119470 [Anneissia japonica]|uniref:uncharacterized protein LOC117119470 n=1 Tax=Anneissia japonica TaxID=1529436 RepID=UPI001425AACC|nr:uncharacterized protein LOC117119470 [Anneissia japonica]
MCLGYHGVGRINENGQRLLELCAQRELCITNTYFQGKHRHKVSWRHMRSGHWHQLDLIITRRRDLPSVLHTRTYHSADCDTDHSLVISKVKFQLRKLHTSKHDGLPRINIAGTKNEAKCQQFIEAMEHSLPAEGLQGNVDEVWNTISSTIYNKTAEKTFGKNRKINKDWFRAHSAEMIPVIEAKNAAYLTHNLNPTVGTFKELKLAKAVVQKTARYCANQYWIKLCEEIQTASDKGDLRTMYEGIKKAIGPTIIKTAPLKSLDGEVLTDKNKQMSRWVEHYLEFYSRETDISQVSLDILPQLPVMGELDQPSVLELSQAIDSLANGKAPGKDGIPAEILKCGKVRILPHLYDLLLLCWRTETIPHDMQDANIITLYKNKGDRRDCNNYRCISLLSVTGKAIAKVKAHLADRIYPEAQCGFRPSRSTVDMIFPLRQLQEKCREQQMPLFIAFVDLTKAFHTISRAGLYKILEKIGCPPKLLNLIHSFHKHKHGTVQFDGSTSNSFALKSACSSSMPLMMNLKEYTCIQEQVANFTIYSDSKRRLR